MKRHFYFALLSTLVSIVCLLSAAAFAQAPPPIAAPAVPASRSYRTIPS